MWAGEGIVVCGKQDVGGAAREKKYMLRSKGVERWSEFLILG